MFYKTLFLLSTIISFTFGHSNPNSDDSYTTVTLPAWEGPLPESWDWRDHNVVTPVKNQAQCGSCWAFASVAAIESAYAIATGSGPVSLSEQELMDCSSRDGCGGGWVDDAFGWVEDHKGLCTEEDYPYLGHDGACHKCEPLVQVKDYVDVAPKDPEALMRAVLQQPVAVAVDASGFSFEYYEKGVMTGYCGTYLSHALLLIGYGVEDGVPYWLIKNSWGSDWANEQGYIKIERLNKKGPGKCGILLAPSYPVIALKNQ